MTRKFAKCVLVCVISVIMLAQPIPAIAAEPTIDFNGGRYTREEFISKYEGIVSFYFIENIGTPQERHVRVTASQIFDKLATVFLPEEYRMSAEQVAEWIAVYEENGGISEVELQLLYYTNLARIRAGVPPLELCPILSMAARFKVEEMAELRYFGHISPVYGNPDNISRELFGIEGMRSENLTRRLTRPRVAYDLIQSWRSSPGHWANMLDPNHRYLGVGIIENVMGMGVNYDATPIPDRYATLGAQKFR